jgi:hypothetical protein
LPLIRATDLSGDCSSPDPSAALKLFLRLPPLPRKEDRPAGSVGAVPLGEAGVDGAPVDGITITLGRCPSAGDPPGAALGGGAPTEGDEGLAAAFGGGARCDAMPLPAFGLRCASGITGSAVASLDAPQPIDSDALRSATHVGWRQAASARCG